MREIARLPKANPRGGHFVRLYDVHHEGIAAEDFATEGMEAKSEEFREAGAEIYS